MARFKDTSSVEKKFEDIFERSPGAFPEGTSLEEKVDYIAKGTKALKAIKNKELESKMKNVAELNKKLESRKSHVAEKVRQDFERIAELDRQYKGKGIFTSEKAAGLENGERFQNTPTTTEGKNFKQASVQTDETPLEHDASFSVSEDSADTPERATAEDKNFEQTSEASVQTDETPSEHDVGFSLVRSPTKEKSNDRRPEQGKRGQPQDNQKEEGLFSLLGRFLKKILEKLLGEDEKSVEGARGMEKDAQKNTLSDEGQQKSMEQSSFININGKELNLEPGKAFSYQDKDLNISITYSNWLKPETVQQGTTTPDIANLNINGKEYNVQPGESFNYKGPGLEISVMNGHQQSKHFDKILSQDQSISEGLEQVTKLDDPSVTPVNTPKVDEISAGRGR